MSNLANRWNRFLYRNRDKGIPNLMLYIVIGSAIVSIMSYATQSYLLFSYLCFDKTAILQGQVWRLFTFIFTEYIDIRAFPFMTLIFCYFFYMLGRRIELTMGTLKFNLFYFSGVLIMDVFALIFAPYGLPNPVYLNMAWYLHLSMLLMFATMQPDAQFLVFYFIPVKAWFMGIIYLLMIVLEISSYRGIFPHSLFPLMGLANYLIFAGRDVLNLFPFIPRRPRYQRPSRKAKRQQQPQSGTIPFRPKDNHPDFNHRCTVCGRTDVTDPQLEFRYCSRCNGYHCYCVDHINNHEHKQ